MEDIFISIIQNREITFGVLFLVMLFYVLWRNQKLIERAELREDKLIEHNRELLNNNLNIISQLDKLETSLERLIDIIMMMEKNIDKNSGDIKKRASEEDNFDKNDI